MTRVLVLGGTGMLGHKLCQVLGDGFETWATVRATPAALERVWPAGRGRIVGSVDGASLDSVVAAVRHARPDVIVNAIGIVKQLKDSHDPVVSLTINSLLPHRLARLADAVGARVIHISTDCVFTGRRGNYSEEAAPDAEDLYGRSKLLGEIGTAPHLTLRTSIIGRELAGATGLVEWFLKPGTASVNGYRRAIFSGLPTLHLAHLVREVIARHPSLSGLYHASADPINKFQLLRLLAAAYRTETEIVPVDEPEIDRSLDSSRLRLALDWKPPSWQELVREMAADSGPYQKWRMGQ